MSTVVERDQAPDLVLTHRSRDERVAAGKAARADVPLEAHAHFTPASGRDPVALLLEQGISRVAELVPVRHGRMLVSPFTFYRGAALPMAADLADDSHVRAVGCSCAGTRTCPISGRSPRRSAGWSSTSTTSTRLCPARSSGTSSGWPPAWRWRAGTTAYSRQGHAARSSSRRSTATGRRCASSRSSPLLDVWYAHLDIEDAIVTFRSQVKAKRFKAAEEMLAKAHTQDSTPGAGQAHHRGRRAATDHQRTRR